MITGIWIDDVEKYYVFDSKRRILGKEKGISMKFKKGDKVRVRTGLSTSEKYDGGCCFTMDMVKHIGQEYTISNVGSNEEGYARYSLSQASNEISRSFTDSMLESVENLYYIDALIKRANEGYAAAVELNEKYRDQTEFRGVGISGFNTDWGLMNRSSWSAVEFRKKEKKIIPPFYVSYESEDRLISPVSVSIIKDAVCVGCQTLVARDVYTALKALIRDNKENTYSISPIVASSTKRGIKFKTYTIYWAEVDILLNKLEEVGYGKD